MGNHLKRQAGVTEANYKKGTIEVRSDPTHGFQIAPVLKSVTEEMGVTPVKRIEATVRGRIVATSTGKAVEVLGTGERLVLEGGATGTEAEQVFKGVIESNRDGTLRFKLTPGQ